MNRVFSAEAYFSEKRLPLEQLSKDNFFGVLRKREKGFLLFEKDAGFVYLKDYGGISFIGPNHANTKDQLNYLEEKFDCVISPFTDTVNIVVDEQNLEEAKGDFGTLYVTKLDLDTIHLVSLNLAQSAALFYYQSLSENLLENTRIHTNTLERKGSVSLKKKNLLKYIGTSLNLKNKISENLFVFESPMLAYEDKQLNKLDVHLNEDLEIKYRYNAVKEQLNIIQENLDLFKDLSLHQHSSNLEWIIIWLILFEVIHVIIDMIIK